MSLDALDALDPSIDDRRHDDERDADRTRAKRAGVARAAAASARLVAEGGPAGDATVTEALLAELAAWLRALDGAVYAALARAAARGPLGALTEADIPGDPVLGDDREPE